MKHLFFLLSTIFILIACQEKNTTSTEFTTFGIENSKLYYEIGERTLSQFETQTDGTNSLMNTWDIPFIKEMDPNDVLLIVEQNKHRQLDYEYVEYVHDSTDALYRHMTKYYKVGRFDWDFETQTPIVKTFPLPKKPEYERQLRVANQILLISILIGFIVLYSKFIIFHPTKK